ncbi:hypothetical protein M231_02913 [Tremella mesenterica]|uniref:PHD-type domain-containing protein n=1 Tax=Tremella mesenterica TaxID=5217 RepID=A0A4Q1BPL3_TREME|nr:hypothetical protein M231_02913 [Tremella mesenterica]
MTKPQSPSTPLMASLEVGAEALDVIMETKEDVAASQTDLAAGPASQEAAQLLLGISAAVDAHIPPILSPKPMVDSPIIRPASPPAVSTAYPQTPPDDGAPSPHSGPQQLPPLPVDVVLPPSSPAGRSSRRAAATINNAVAGPSRLTRPEDNGKRPAHWMGEDNDTIRCICGLTEDDGYSIQCETCYAWQHMLCFRITDQALAPEVWYCELCEPRPVDAEWARDFMSKRLDDLYNKQVEDVKTPAPEKKTKSKPRAKRSRMGSVMVGEMDPESGKDQQSGTGAMGPPISKPRKKVNTGKRTKQSTTESTPGPMPRDPIPPLNLEGYYRQAWKMEYIPVEEVVFRNDRSRRLYQQFRRDQTEEEDVATPRKRSTPNPTGLPSPTETGVVRLSPDRLLPRPNFGILAPPVPPIHLSGPPSELAHAWEVRPVENSDSFLPPRYEQSSYSTFDSLGTYARPTIYAVFADEELDMGAFVGDFTGEVVDPRTYRSDPINQYSGLGTTKPHVRSIGPPVNLIIDARSYGCDLRYIRSGCHPNVVLRPYLCRSVDKSSDDFDDLDHDDPADQEHTRLDLRFGIFAAKRVEHGEELVLPWEWDDKHLVHILHHLIIPAMTPDGNIAPPSYTIPQSRAVALGRQIEIVLTHLYSTFSSCACQIPGNCALAQLKYICESLRRDEYRPAEGIKEAANLGELIGKARMLRSWELEEEEARRRRFPEGFNLAFHLSRQVDREPMSNWESRTKEQSVKKSVEITPTATEVNDGNSSQSEDSDDSDRDEDMDIDDSPKRHRSSSPLSNTSQTSRHTSHLIESPLSHPQSRPESRNTSNMDDIEMETGSDSETTATEVLESEDDTDLEMFSGSEAEVQDEVKDFSQKKNQVVSPVKEVIKPVSTNSAASLEDQKPALPISILGEKDAVDSPQSARAMEDASLKDGEGKKDTGPVVRSKTRRMSSVSATDTNMRPTRGTRKTKTKGKINTKRNKNTKPVASSDSEDSTMDGVGVAPGPVIDFSDDPSGLTTSEGKANDDSTPLKPSYHGPIGAGQTIKDVEDLKPAKLGETEDAKQMEEDERKGESQVGKREEVPEPPLDPPKKISIIEYLKTHKIKKDTGPTHVNHISAQPSNLEENANRPAPPTPDASGIGGRRNFMDFLPSRPTFAQGSSTINTSFGQSTSNTPATPGNIKEGYFTSQPISHTAPNTPGPTSKSYVPRISSSFVPRQNSITMTNQIPLSFTPNTVPLNQFQPVSTNQPSQPLYIPPTQPNQMNNPPVQPTIARSPQSTFSTPRDLPGTPDKTPVELPPRVSSLIPKSPMRTSSGSSSLPPMPPLLDVRDPPPHRVGLENQTNRITEVSGPGSRRSVSDDQGSRSGDVSINKVPPTAPRGPKGPSKWPMSPRAGSIPPPTAPRGYVSLAPGPTAYSGGSGVPSGVPSGPRDMSGAIPSGSRDMSGASSFGPRDMSGSTSFGTRDISGSTSSGSREITGARDPSGFENGPNGSNGSVPSYPSGQNGGYASKSPELTMVEPRQVGYNGLAEGRMGLGEGRSERDERRFPIEPRSYGDGRGNSFEIRNGPSESGRYGSVESRNGQSEPGRYGSSEVRNGPSEPGRYPAEDRLEKNGIGNYTSSEYKNDKNILGYTEGRSFGPGERNLGGGYRRGSGFGFAPGSGSGYRGYRGRGR